MSAAETEQAGCLSLNPDRCLLLTKDVCQPLRWDNNMLFMYDIVCCCDRPSASTTKEVAQLLASGKIIGWYQGHGECGPRALGNRSILMNPALKDGKETLNDRVKHREWFRPFGASILEEKVSDYFDWNQPSPYMLYVMDVLDKESFPAITHVDGTCRPQTVTPEQEDYYNLISEFENLTGVPMVLNTSLNNGGKAICGNILDAMELLCKSEMDALVVGNTIYEK